MTVCRGCGHRLRSEDVFCDLGAQPLANELLTEAQLEHAQAVFPLRPMICWNCTLVQLPHCPSPEEIFKSDYPFYAGRSTTWAAHCRELADMLVTQHGLGPTSRVLDIGSNDGTMLRRFRGRGIPAIGIEPCAEVAQHAQMEGLNTIVDWWSTETAYKLLRTKGVSTGKSWKADVVTCTNVLAHVPNLIDFLNGVRTILNPANGVAYFEFPYLGTLVEDCQFEQIYAEHHCYFSLHSLRSAMQRAGLRMCGAEFIPDIHGGSMRVSADTGRQDVMDINLAASLRREDQLGLSNVDKLRAFRSGPPRVKRRVHSLLAGWEGRKVMGYGASAKAAVALNYFGIGPETIEFVADVTPDKWGKYIPGCRIPIRTEDALAKAKPDVVVNFAWNWAAEAEHRIRRACGQDVTIGYLNKEPEYTEAVA